MINPRERERERIGPVVKGIGEKMSFGDRQVYVALYSEDLRLYVMNTILRKEEKKRNYFFKIFGYFSRN